MALNGYETDLNNISNAVYRVKKSGTDEYTRVHFETSSKMICDATPNNESYKVVKRSNTGDIAVSTLRASSAMVNGGNIECDNGSIIVRDGLLLALGGSNTYLEGALSVVKKTTLGSSLDVRDVSTFQGQTTHKNGAVLEGLVEIKSGTDKDGEPSAGRLIVYGGSVSAETGFHTGGSVTAGGDILNGGSLRISKTATFQEDVVVGTDATVNGTLTVGRFALKNPSVDWFVPGLMADLVDGCHVNDDAISSTTLWTSSKTNATKADKTITVTGANGLTGTGNLGSNIIISHGVQGAITPTVSTSSSTINQVISGITISNYGHVTAVTKTDLDKRYPTITKVSEDIANANLTVTRDLIAKSPTDRKTNGNTLVMENFTIQYNANSIDFVFA